MGRAMERGMEEREESDVRAQPGIRPAFAVLTSSARKKIICSKRRCRGCLLPNYWLKEPLNSILLQIAQNFHKLVNDAHLSLFVGIFTMIILKHLFWRTPQSDLQVPRFLWNVSIIFLPWEYIHKGGIYLFVSKYNENFPLCACHRILTKNESFVLVDPLLAGPGLILEDLKVMKLFFILLANQIISLTLYVSLYFNTAPSRERRY